MKLSEIIKIKNLNSATVYVIHPNATTCEFFISGKKRPILKSYRNFDVNIDLVDGEVFPVNSSKRFRYWKNGAKYVNVYNY